MEEYNEQAHVQGELYSSLKKNKFEKVGTIKQDLNSLLSNISILSYTNIKMIEIQKIFFPEIHCELLSLLFVLNFSSISNSTNL